MSMRLTKKIIAMCFAVGMTLMPMGQAFANEEGETLVETTNVQQDEAPEMMSESEVASEAEKVIECEEETVKEPCIMNEVHCQGRNVSKSRKKSARLNDQKTIWNVILPIIPNAHHI